MLVSTNTFTGFLNDFLFNMYLCVLCIHVNVYYTLCGVIIQDALVRRLNVFVNMYGSTYIRNVTLAGYDRFDLVRTCIDKVILVFHDKKNVRKAINENLNETFNCFKLS